MVVRTPDVIDVSKAALNDPNERVHIEYEYAPGKTREATGKVVDHPERLLDSALIETSYYPDSADYRILNHGTVESRTYNYGLFRSKWKTVGFLRSVESVQSLEAA